MAMVNYLHPKTVQPKTAHIKTVHSKTAHEKTVFAALIISSVFIILTHQTAEAKELQSTGSYSVRLSDSTHHLNCRTGPGTNFPVRAQLEHGETIQVIHATSHSKPWFYTNMRCFVRANSRFLKWQEDPKSSKPQEPEPTIIR